MKGIRSLLALLALALVVAACGGSSGSRVETLPPVGDPLVSSGCEEGVPDCDDMIDADEPLFIGDEPNDGVPPGQATTGFPVLGGLTVGDALSTDATGVLAIQGFVVADADGARLCDLLAESLPPQCGGDHVGLSGLDGIDPTLLKDAQGVQWTDLPITLFGEIIDGTFVVDPLVSG